MKEMDSCISSIFLNEDQDAFIQLFNLILYENVNGRKVFPLCFDMKVQIVCLWFIVDFGTCITSELRARVSCFFG